MNDEHTLEFIVDRSSFIVILRRVEKQKLKPQVVLLGFVSLLNDSASEMIYPLLPVFLTVTLGATPFDVGLIEGVADAIASILKYYAGSWSDRLTRRRPLISTGYALAAGSRALIAAAVAWPWVLAARLIDRTGKGIRSAPRDALISDVTPVEQRGKAYGFHRALDHTGAIVGPLMAMLFLQGFHLQMRTVFYIAVIPGFIAVVLLTAVLKEEPREPRTTSSTTTTSPTPLPGRFWAALGAIALFSLANSSDVFLLLQANAGGVPTAMLPLLWAAHHVIKALFSTRAGSLSDRMDRRTLLVVGWLSYAVIYFAFPIAHSMTSFFVLFILYAIPFTLTEGAERAWISTMVPAEARGRSFGLYYLATGIFVLLGTLLFGAIYEHVSHTAAFATGASIAVIAALFVIFTPAARPTE
jgi:MFS family permease